MMLGKIEFSHPKPRGEGRVWSFMFELQSESIAKFSLAHTRFPYSGR